MATTRNGYEAFKGGIQQQSKNSFRICVDMGIGPDGKRRRHFETVRGGKKDAQARKRELETSRDKGVYVPPGRMTVGELLTKWLDGYVAAKCTARTLDGYRMIAETHLMPAVGHIPLKQLNQQQIQEYYGQACAKLSARTVHHHHRVLSQALKWAVRNGYLGLNPAALTDPPSPEKKDMRTMTASEVQAFLDAAAEHDTLYPVVYVALNTGMRQAELLGLRWRDVDLDLLSISVNRAYLKRRGVATFKEPKTEGSRRSVAMTPKLGLFLRSYRDRQECDYGQLGQTLTLDDLVFSKDGKPLDPSVLSHLVGKVAARAGIGHVRFHDLRHTFASLALQAGAKPKVISEALGHASVAFTMDVYSHIIKGMQEEAMALLNEVMPEGRLANEMSRFRRDLSVN